MHTEQVLTNATSRVYQMVDNYGHNASAQANVTPEQKAAVQKAQDEAHEVIGKQLSWDAVKGDFIQAYAEAFTGDDLKGLVEFLQFAPRPEARREAAGRDRENGQAHPAEDDDRHAGDHAEDQGGPRKNRRRSHPRRLPERPHPPRPPPH